MSEAKQMALALTARLANISVANGYLTDIGARVFRGRRRLDESQIPCVVIIEDDDDVQDENRRLVKIAQKYFIEGHAECDPDHPNDTAHDIIEDIKRAVFSGTEVRESVKESKYKGRTIQPREDGTAIVAASVEVHIVFVENKDRP